MVDKHDEAPEETGPVAGSALRRFGVRTAALAGLFVAVAVPLAGAGEDGSGGTATEVVIAEIPPTPNPSTCCH